MTNGQWWICWSMVIVMQAGCIYQATVPCDGCSGTQTKTVTGDPDCEREYAEEKAREDCEELGGEPRESEIKVRAFLSFGCFFGSSKQVPSRPTSLLQSAVRAVVPSPVATEANEPFNCGGFTFDVIAINNRIEEEYPCRDDRLVRVGYSRINPETQAVEDVFEDKLVPAGTQYTFTCPDVYATREDGTPDPNGTANFVYVVFQQFSERPESKCVPIPFGQGGFSRSLNGQIRNGGQVEITLLPPGQGATFDVKITNPSSSTLTKVQVARTHGLKPIPDPKFTNERSFTP